MNPDYSLEGMMLKLKLQYFSHLMWRVDSLEKTLMLGKIKGKRRRGQQRMRCLDSITDSIDVKWNESHSVMSDSVRPHRRQPARLPRPWDSPGKNTGVGCHFLLQCMKVKSEREVAQSCQTLNDPMDYTVHGICQARILEWVAFPFSRGSSQPRDRTQVSCIGGRFFTSWATREAP